MTQDEKEDAILDVLKEYFDCGNTYGYEVAEKIIEVLKTEDCEDVVSREEILKVVNNPFIRRDKVIEELPLVTPAGTEVIFTRKELESWLYSICFNNIGTDLCEDVLEIISRLDGFEKYIEDMRGGE